MQRGQSLLIDRGKGNVDKVLREQHLADNFRFLGEMGIPGTRGGFPELSGVKGIRGVVLDDEETRVCGQ